MIPIIFIFTFTPSTLLSTSTIHSKLIQNHHYRIPSTILPTTKNNNLHTFPHPQSQNPPPKSLTDPPIAIVPATEASVDTLDPGGDEEQRRRNRNRRGGRYRPCRHPLGVPALRGRARPGRGRAGEGPLGQHRAGLEAQTERRLPARQAEGPFREAETHQRLRPRHGDVRNHRDGHRERTVQRRCLHQGERATCCLIDDYLSMLS